MRISPSPTPWLAAASCFAIVYGDVVTFDNAEFINRGTDGAPVFIPSDDISERAFRGARRFPFTINPTGTQPGIASINLYVNHAQVADSTVSISSTATSSSADAPPIPMPTTSSNRLAGLQHASQRPSKASYTPGVVPLMNVRRDFVSPMKLDSANVVESGGSPPTIDVSITSTSAGGTVTLNMTQVRLASAYVGQEMYFELLWDTTPQGKSYSRVFTVLAPGQEAYAHQLAGQAPYNVDRPAEGELAGGGGNETPPTGLGGTTPTVTHAPSSMTSASTSDAASATTSDGVAPALGGSEPGSSKTSSGGGGLSTGAIAGIAVAAALVGLGLLATLVFCLVRRRRRRRGDHSLAGSAASPGGYGNRGMTPELMAQKEANASVGVVATASPHSPYSDDGGGHAGGLRHGNAAAAAATATRQQQQQQQQQQQEAPLAGYAGRAVSHRSAAEDAGSLRGSLTGGNTPGRSTPTAVRHLVEEGMTEEEIRRLEEEERELDQAIEQAGNGGRRGR